jgi:hypothetical protein
MKAVSGSWSAQVGWAPAAPAFAEGAEAGGVRTLVLAFAEVSPETAAAAIDELRSALPEAVVVGCSTAGLILGDEVCTDGLVAVAIHFSDVVPRIAVADVAEGPTSFEVGRLLGARLAPVLPPDEAGTVLVLADGLAVNGTALVDGLSLELPAGIGVSGGLAGDGDRFDRTWVYAGGSILEGAVVAVALVGDGLTVGYGSAGGWDGFGPYRTVTGSSGNVLSTLDGRPALALYKEYLGDRADQLPASALLFPLLIRSPEGDVELVRTVRAVDEDTSSMTFAGDIPTGWTARLMRTTLDRLVDAATLAAEEAARDMPTPELTVAISCVGRRLVLGQRTDEEVEAAADQLSGSGPVIGFYSYGEISPSNGVSELHNQTMTLTTFSEPGR